MIQNRYSTIGIKRQSNNSKPKDIHSLLLRELSKHKGIRTNVVATIDLRTAREIPMDRIVATKIFSGERCGDFYIPPDYGQNDTPCVYKLCFNYAPRGTSAEKNYFLYGFYTKTFEIIDQMVNMVQGSYVYVLVNGATLEIVKIKIEDIANIITDDFNKYIEERDNNCFDCKDKIEEKDRNKFNNRIYCKSCYDEAIQICDECGKKEESGTEFVPVFVEDSGKQKLVTLCIKCCKTVSKCGNQFCKISVKATKEVCESCDNHYCDAHTDGHKCTGAEPRHLFRNVSTNFMNGEENKAKHIFNKRCVGIELEAINGNPDKAMDNLNRNIGVVHDGSIEGNMPIELVTPPARYNDLEDILVNSTRCLKDAGFKINKSCGVHMHIDSPDFNNDGNKLFQVIATYYAIEPVIFSMLPKSRRNNKYALPLKSWIDETKMMKLSSENITYSDLEEIWYKSRSSEKIGYYKDDKYDSSRYHGFNMHCIFRYNHLELRYHHGTLNPVKIRNWINMNLLFVDWAVDNYDKNVVNAIFHANTPLEKLRIMVRHMKISRELRRYITRNMKKFENVDEDSD